jgi:helicase
MNPSLARWMGDADAQAHLHHFKVTQGVVEYAYIGSRIADYYIALVGELFARLAEGGSDSATWSRLGNSLSQLATGEMSKRAVLNGISRNDALLFSAAAYYCGGFPASAYLTIRELSPKALEGELLAAAYDMLARPKELRSSTAVEIQSALREGSQQVLARIASWVMHQTRSALNIGPQEWVSAKILEQVINRFSQTNIRKVLPDGDSEFWNSLVESFLDRKPPTWEFFPSQIAAIRAGLLTSSDTFSLQMPTGAGKTTLCETLLFTHAKRNPASVAVLLVPYRSLAAELRASIVKNLIAMGISSRCAYGGTVPNSDEVKNLDDTRVIVATPESLSGLLSADQDFFKRISLVICDEGHLLDGGGRGVALELLLARMRARVVGAPRFVFVSAIVPNIEEINTWLGGSSASVIRSDYRPATAEFARLSPAGKGVSAVVDLLMHPQEEAPTRFTISQFLSRTDFTTKNPQTGRNKTYNFESVKTQAIAAARKALAMGAVAVFAANKRGHQGCIGLAEELLEQLKHDLSLPRPSDSMSTPAVKRVADYLVAEYGSGWVASASLAAGAVVHHGDIPQEARELLEGLIRANDIKFIICTSTLAEGVNLPIRTLVLYSVERMLPGGDRENMFSRDIKNLVGRAGRAGSTTKGLVICANQRQWPLVEKVAKQAPGEAVRGALRELMTRLRNALARVNRMPTNELLESAWAYVPLLDGIDMTLMDLAAEEIGEEQLAALATELADQTFASSQATEDSRQLLRTVFSLRAARVSAVKNAGRLDWVRSTGTRVRLLDAVERDLLPKRNTWDDILSPIDPTFVRVMLEWAWSLPEVDNELRDAFHLERKASVVSAREMVSQLVARWLTGERFAEMAGGSGLHIDELLGVHTKVVTFALQTAIEQGLALLQMILGSQLRVLSEAASVLPEHLRYGVPTRAGCVLATHGLRHRRAYVLLGTALERHGTNPFDVNAVRSDAVRSLNAFRDQWLTALGELVYVNTLSDLQDAQ